MDNFDKQLGAKLREKRLLAGMSMKAVGEAVGITYQQMSKYEASHNRVSCSRLQELAGVLETNISYFFDDNGYVDDIMALKVAKAFMNIKDGRVRSGVLRLIKTLEG